MDIRALLERINNGDRQAFAQVVAHYQRPLFGFLGRMALSSAHAEEIAQETFLRAWRKLADFDPSLAAFSTWLFTIARNLALHELERAAHRRENAVLDDVAEPACERPQPEAQLAGKQQRQRLQAALHRLSLQERSALALAYIEEMDLAVVARIEACSVGALKTRLHRAKEKLKQLLEENDG
ncbi:RNA polymerase sigma factor [Rugamonas sp. CCM 8940]|uniref:RNA polymerase sigma factor n=1 Tax=Rugamonas sp. CCM 8940 TaxID=2765359 RepID=UPI0018F6EC53|nr:sigma-70 family RNA polymerase sigma factor [Rugamonas sp. CCM 8940]